MVVLQIGDIDYNISRQNFRRLEGEFEEKVSPLPGERYFLDRNGDLFEYILRYLRYGNITFPDSFEDGGRLTKEAEFYGLKELQQHLIDGAGRKEVVTITLMTPHEVKEKPEDQKKMLLHYRFMSGTGVREWVAPHPLPKERKATGTDIILHWSTESSPNKKKMWKAVTENLWDKFNFRIFKCEGINPHDGSVDMSSEWLLEYEESTLKHVLEKDSPHLDEDLIFNIKDDNVMRLINCFLCSGFTLLSDKRSTDKSRFRKKYKIMREMKFQRIKPVPGVKIK